MLCQPHREELDEKGKEKSKLNPDEPNPRALAKNLIREVRGVLFFLKG